MRWLLFFSALLLRAQSGATLEGKVTSPDGSPVRKATVLLRAARLVGAAPDRDSYVAETGASGTFQFDDVAPGLYECLASRTGFEAGPPDRKFKPVYVTVASGQHVDSLVLHLTPLGVVSGRVLDPDGQPLPDAEVSALQFSYDATGKKLVARRQATSDDRGEFRLFALYPGAYYLRASPLAEGAMSRYSSFGPDGVNRRRFVFGPPRNQVRGPAPPAVAVTYFPGSLDSAQARVVELAPGGEVSDSDIHVQRRALFSVTGRAASPGDAGPLMVTSRSDPEAGFPTGRLETDGTFEVRGLPPGSYVVQTLLPNRRPDGSRGLLRASFDLAGQDLEGVPLELFPFVRISGVARAAGKTPVVLAGTQITLQQDGGRLTIGELKPDGTFMLDNVMADVYHLGFGGDAYITSIKSGDAELPGGLLDLRRQPGAKLLLTVSADTGVVQGTVTGGDGAPLPGAVVSLVPDQSPANWQARYQAADSDAQGRFEFTKVVPGRYRAFAWKDVPADAPRDAGFRAPFEKAAVTITVGSQSRQALELKAIP